MGPLDESTIVSADAELSHGWARGDERSFERLVERYAPVVHARCRRALPGSDADDAAQAVFLVLARRSSQAASSPLLLSWLLRVTENVVRNAQRDRTRRWRAEARVRREAPVLSPHHPGSGEDQAELQLHLDSALEQLPASERDAIVLHYLAGHSLAEVARLTSSGLSTIKDRIQRGLTRLRDQLERRGATLSPAALTASLPQGTPPLPAELLKRLALLKQVPPHALPSHVRRWSRQGPTMTTIVGSLIAGSLLVTASITQCSIHAAEPTAAATAARTADQNAPPLDSAPAPAAPSLSDIEAALDPEHARTWVTASWHDGRRTAERLKSLPELELLADHGVAVTAAIASLHDASFEASLDELEPRELVVGSYRLRHEIARLPPAERTRRFLAWQEQTLRRMVADRKPGQPTFPGTPVLHARLHATAPDALPLTWLANQLGRRPASAATVVPLLPAWLFGSSLHHALTGSTLTIDCDPGTGTAALSVPAAPVADGDSDFECAFAIDPGNGTLAPLGGVSCTVTRDGLHMVLNQAMPWDPPGSPQPRIDRARLAGIPADAVLALALALTPETTAASQGLMSACQALIAPLKLLAHDAKFARRLAIAEAVTATIKRIDGQVLFYVQPNAPLPMITLEADVPETAWVDLRSAIGSPLAEDGSTTIPLGMVSLGIGWQQGHLLLTTNPGGLAAASTSSGGFTAQPEIRKALAALPAGEPQLLTLLRPEAFARCCGPFVGMLAPPLATQLPAYEQRLQEQTAYGYLVVVPAHGAVHVEASGLLSFAAAAFLASELKSPSGVN